MAPYLLPVGFRFHPTDEELLTHYLQRKIASQNRNDGLLPEVDVLTCEPWELPLHACLDDVEGKWFFFCPCDARHLRGSRRTRTTASGFWKSTGPDTHVRSRASGHVVGLKKTLVFYLRDQQRHTRTEWVMHEFRLQDDVKGTEKDGSSQSSQGRKDFVVCRVFKKVAAGAATCVPPRYASESAALPVAHETILSSSCAIDPRAMDPNASDPSATTIAMASRRLTAHVATVKAATAGLRGSGGRLDLNLDRTAVAAVEAEGETDGGIGRPHDDGVDYASESSTSSPIGGRSSGSEADAETDGSEMESEHENGAPVWPEGNGAPLVWMELTPVCGETESFMQSLLFDPIQSSVIFQD